MAGTRRQSALFLTMLVLRFDTVGPIRECVHTRRTTTPTGPRVLNTDSRTRTQACAVFCGRCPVVCSAFESATAFRKIFVLSFEIRRFRTDVERQSLRHWILLPSEVHAGVQIKRDLLHEFGGAPCPSPAPALCGVRFGAWGREEKYLMTSRFLPTGPVRHHAIRPQIALFWGIETLELLPSERQASDGGKTRCTLPVQWRSVRQSTPGPARSAVRHLGPGKRKANDVQFLIHWAFGFLQGRTRASEKEQVGGLIRAILNEGKAATAEGGSVLARGVADARGTRNSDAVSDTGKGNC